MVDFTVGKTYTVTNTQVLKNYLDYTEKHGEEIEEMQLVANELDKGWTVTCVSEDGTEVTDVISPTIVDQLIVDGVLEEQ